MTGAPHPTALAAALSRLQLASQGAPEQGLAAPLPAGRGSSRGLNELVAEAATLHYETAEASADLQARPAPSCAPVVLLSRKHPRLGTDLQRLIAALETGLTDEASRAARSLSGYAAVSKDLRVATMDTVAAAMNLVARAEELGSVLEASRARASSAVAPAMPLDVAVAPCPLVWCRVRPSWRQGPAASADSWMSSSGAWTGPVSGCHWEEPKAPGLEGGPS